MYNYYFVFYAKVSQNTLRGQKSTWTSNISFSTLYAFVVKVLHPEFYVTIFPLFAHAC